MRTAALIPGAKSKRRLSTEINSRFMLALDDSALYGIGGFEGRGLVLGDCDGCASFGVAAGARCALHDFEGAKTADFDVIACPTVGCMRRASEEEWISEINGQTLETYKDGEKTQ